MYFEPAADEVPGQDQRHSPEEKDLLVILTTLLLSPVRIRLGAPNLLDWVGA